MFQHRHYVKLAAMVASLPADIRDQVVEHFADELKGTNPRFDAERFRTAARGKPSNGRDRAATTTKTVAQWPTYRPAE